MSRIGGGGSHSINVAFKALNLRALWDGDPARRTIRVETEVSQRWPDNYPRWQIVHFGVPARGSLPPAHIYWYHGSLDALKRQGIWQRLEKTAGRPPISQRSRAPRSGSLLVGSKGVVHTNAYNSVCALLPEGDFSNQVGHRRSCPARAATSGGGSRHARATQSRCPTSIMPGP
ncbi:MAG TPA: hypothetical protein EYP56_06565 [Planctomycetaceae bacterium]|nr:hypothetical protein [Planctomycetaceae bacterium]